MSVKTQLFINSISMVEIDGWTNIPTVLYYEKGRYYIGYDAHDSTESADLINENFKLELGKQDPAVFNRKQFATGSGETRSAHVLTRDFVERALQHVTNWIESRGLKKAGRILVAEPIAMGETDTTKSSWLSNYRDHLKRILKPKFEEVDFLPEPFAAFQYYRYGIRHPLVAEQVKHVALVLDFGGGTFDVSLIETTAQGDISIGGRNSRPLAAASIPVGGFFINRTVAEVLLFQALRKTVDKTEVRRALKAYDELRNASTEELAGLRGDYRSLIRHFKRTVYEVEKAKIAICNSIANWELDATYPVNPGYHVSVPQNPLREDPEWAPVRLDAYKLRDLFERQVWGNRLRQAISDALVRATGELEGKPISLVLLSGGSSNIRWLGKLIRRDLGTKLPEAEILELQENCQEIVAKGVAVECARRTYNQGSGDFHSVTYNRLCLALASDGGQVEIKRFRPVTEGLPSESREEGVLLRSASVLAGFIDKPMRWKVSLNRPPKHTLDYYFMRASFDYEDVHNLHNVDHRVHTPADTGFDAGIQVELTVREDGTTTPRFIYRQGAPGIQPIEVMGQPFYVDMTFGAQSAVGEAYIGFDFGTSNSSFSYVEQGAIKAYSERGKDKNWRELSDLVSALPYPVAAPLAKFIAETTRERLDLLGLETFEAFLCLAAYVSYSEYRCVKGSAQTKLLKGFRQRSAGPLWALLKGALQELRGCAHFSRGYLKLVEEPFVVEFDQAVGEVAKFKHGKKAVGLDYVRILGILGNVTNRVFAEQIFGSFEAVTKQRLKREYTGFFRCARGPSAPFIDLYEYSGRESFSDEQVFVCDPETGQALLVTPLMLWVQAESGTRRWEPQLFMFDIAKDGEFGFKATEVLDELVARSDNEWAPIFEELQRMRDFDPQLAVIEHVRLQKAD